MSRACSPRAILCALALWVACGAEPAPGDGDPTGATADAGSEAESASDAEETETAAESESGGDGDGDGGTTGEACTMADEWICSQDPMFIQECDGMTWSTVSCDEVCTTAGNGLNAGVCIADRCICGDAVGEPCTNEPEICNTAGQHQFCSMGWTFMLDCELECMRQGQTTGVCDDSGAFAQCACS